MATRSFSELKKARQENFNKLVDKINKISNPFGEEDPRFWAPTVDKSGNGFAVIRFLPAPPGEDLPFVMVWDHGFQGPGGWYIEKSRTTLGESDPAGEYNTMLWNRDGPGDRDFVRGIPKTKESQGKPGSKRRLLYYSNILVVKDPAKPENNGKVFIYRYGAKIYDKIKEMAEAEEHNPDKVLINVFDPWEGCNFQLNIGKKDGYRNYDKSKFDSPSALCGGDEKEMEAIWNLEHSLKEFVDPKNFKSYTELQQRLHKILNLSAAGVTPPHSPPEMATTESKTETEIPPWEPEAATTTITAEDNDPDLAEFRALVQ